MPFDKAFKEIINGSIDSLIAAVSDTSSDIRNHQAIWKYDHAFDFCYGQTVGRISGLAYSVFVSQYRRQPNLDEQREINSIIVARAKEIRDAMKHLKAII
jgi:hypothetical protein